MKRILFFLILLPIYLQSQVRDDFSDGNFTLNPVWTGDTSAFKVNSQYQLQLSSSESDTSCLITKVNSFEDMEWSFYVRMSFNTSLNNYVRIYLYANMAEIYKAADAIYIQVGGPGDSVFLVRQNGFDHIPLFTYPLLRTNKSNNLLCLKVRKDTSGNWEMMADSLGGRRFITYGTFNYNYSFPSGWMGLFCRYTSSNSTKIYLDDFYAGKIISDTTHPVILSAGFSDSLTIRVKCSEYIDSACLEMKSNFALKNNPVKLLNTYILKEEQDIIYIKINRDEKSFFCDSLIVTNLSDISSNTMADTSVYICYYIPGPCLAGDVLINEVLFDPDTRGSRFIEFYNNSEKIIDLGTLLVGTATGTGSSYKYCRLSDPDRKLPPRHYYAITSDSVKLCSRYYVPYPENIAQPEHFPSMSSDSGAISVLKDVDSIFVDEMGYSKNMHLKFLSTTEGVSLERLNFGISSDCRSNWQSASGTSGFSSPGYENSHYAVNPERGPDMELSSTVFSPDNDGKDDFLTISLHNVESGTLVSVRVYDINGNLVKSVADPSAVSEKSLFIWDGTSNENSIVEMGYYIVFYESISASGKHSRDKKSVAVVRKF